MTRIYADTALFIGHMPLIRLNRILDGAAAIVLARIKGAIRPIPSNAGSGPR